MTLLPPLKSPLTDRLKRLSTRSPHLLEAMGLFRRTKAERFAVLVEEVAEHAERCRSK
jgi:hypothetical protein